MTTTAMPRPARRRMPRLLREVASLAAVWVIILAAPHAYTLLSDLLPLHVWWPLLTGGPVAVWLALDTPPWGTTVAHAVRCTGRHPGTAVLLIAVVCLPWLAGWVGDLVVLGIRQGVEVGIRTVADSAGGGAAWAQSLLQRLIGGGQ